MDREDEVNFRVGLPVLHLDGDGLSGAIRRPREAGSVKSFGESLNSMHDVAIYLHDYTQPATCRFKVLRISRVVIVEHPRGEEVLSLDDVGRLRVQPLHCHLVPTVRRSVVDAHPHHSPMRADNSLFVQLHYGVQS